MRVIANVDEADIGQVDEGQNVKFTVDAYPNDVFDGKVTQVRLEAKVTSNVVTYEVVISAHNPDLKLKPGLTASVTILTLERNDVLTIPSKALRFIPDEAVLLAMNITVVEANNEMMPGKRIVWAKEGNNLIPKLISVGITSMNLIEVVDGLSENDEIVMDLTTELPDIQNTNQVERSPFMPGPPQNRRR